MNHEFALSQRQDFDFDEMMKLARNSPDEFSKRRMELIETAILNSRDSEKVKRLHKVIESDRIREWSHEVAAVYFSKHFRLIPAELEVD